MGLTDRAIVLRATGGPEVLVLEDRPVPRAGPNQLLVRHTAIGVNFHDTYVRSGLYQTLPLPGVPGLEAAAVVEAVGPDVAGFSPGDRIAYIDERYGAYSERRLLPASLAVKLPDYLDDETAASLTIKGLTACMLLMHVRPVRAGETVLVHAAAGAVGQSLVRWARHLGVTVIATVGAAEKAEVARRCGADHVILYRSENFVERVRELTDGHGVAVAFDGVGADTFEGSLDCLDFLGTLVNFGQASGPVPPFRVARLSARSNAVVRPMLFHYIRGREALEAMAARTFEAVRDGVLRANVALRLPLAAASEAHRALEARSTAGSIVLVPHPTA